MWAGTKSRWCAGEASRPASSYTARPPNLRKVAISSASTSASVILQPARSLMLLLRAECAPDRAVFRSFYLLSVGFLPDSKGEATAVGTLRWLFEGTFPG